MLFALSTTALLVGSCMLFTLILIRLCNHFGWSIMEKGSVGNYVFGIGLLLLFAPTMVLTIYWSDKHYDQIELNALKARGVAGEFVIENSHYERDDEPYYLYDFRIADNKGHIHELNVSRSGNREIFIGDSVSVIYLAANPTVFREVGKMGE